MNMPIDEIDHLSEIVHRLVNQYLRQKVKARTHEDPYDKKFKKDVDGREKAVLTREVFDAWVRTCQQTHLEVRSRNANDFSPTSLVRSVPTRNSFPTKIGRYLPDTSSWGIGKRSRTWSTSACRLSQGGSNPGENVESIGQTALDLAVVNRVNVIEL